MARNRRQVGTSVNRRGNSISCDGGLSGKCFTCSWCCAHKPNDHNKRWNGIRRCAINGRDWKSGGTTTCSRSEPPRDNMKSRTRQRTLGIYTLWLLVVGCAGPSQDNALLQVWQAPSSSLEERAEAISKLIPKGTKMAEAERVLGQPTRRERWHGPSLLQPSSGATSPAGGYTDEDRLIYDFPGGGVIYLRFDALASDSKSQNRPFVGAVCAHTNDFQFIPFGTKTSNGDGR